MSERLWERGKHMVKVKLLGRPQAFLDGEHVNLPFKQAEALLYYLAMEGEVDKFSLADLVWGDKYGAEKIRSNMRNATYVLRKAFGREFILEPTKNTLCLNAQLGLETDVTQFCRGGAEELALYTGDFLEGFYLKENELYNEWAENTRQRCRAIFSDRLKACITQTYAGGEADECEALCRRLMALDEFDETSYKYLIALCKDKKDYTGAIAVYAQLEKLLAEELFELPGQELRDIAEDVKRQRNRELSQIVSEKSSISAAVKREQSVFHGRKRELAVIGNVLDAFLGGAPAVSLLIQGEAGIGKTWLAEHALAAGAARGAAVLRARCYHAEENYILKPWQSIFEQLMDMLPRRSTDTRERQLMAAILTFFPYLKRDGVSTIDLDAISTVKYTNAEKLIASALEQLAQAHRLILYFDDVQWADETSVSLLRSLMTAGRGRNIQFVFTCREEQRDYTEALFADAAMAGRLERLSLERFDYEDTVSLAHLLMPDYGFTKNIESQLYHETEGNPFFIIEMLNNIRYNGSLVDITPNIRDVIKNRVQYLTVEGKKLLELVALFFDGAPFTMLLELSGKNEYELAEALEYLMSKRLLREEPHYDGVQFQFTHQKILEYVYGEMPLSKRAVLHNKVGACYERRLTGKNSDVLLYTKLIYHFEKSGNHKKHLRYSVKYLYSYLNTAHEYYPVLDGGNYAKVYAGTFGPAADFEGVEKRLGKIAEELEEPSMGAGDEQDAELLSDFCHMMGRNLIRKVEYESGLTHIFRLKELNRACVTQVQQMYLLKANRQLICVYINRYETDRMRETIDESYRILQKGYKKEETAIWNRLEGLLFIMTGDIENGIARLTEAISIFESSREKALYLFNLAASYAWLGEAQRHLMNYEAADRYYRYAIALCEDNCLISGACTFYTYAGLAAFDSGDVEAAGAYLEQAVRGYDRVDLMWGRGMAHCYFALVCLRRGEYARALDYLRCARGYAEKLQSDYEKGVVCRVSAQIAAQMKSDAELSRVFGGYLTESAEEYAKRARHLLRHVYSPIDISYLTPQ